MENKELFNQPNKPVPDDTDNFASGIPGQSGANNHTWLQIKSAIQSSINGIERNIDEPVVSTGSLVIDFNSKEEVWAIFSGGGGIQIDENVIVSLINDGNKQIAHIWLDVQTTTREITFGSSFDSSDPRWDGTKLSLVAGNYLVKLYFDGANMDQLEVLPFDNTSNELTFAASDEDTDLALGEVFKIRLNRSFSFTELSGGVTTAPTGSNFIFDLKKNGTSVLSTLVTIEATEFVSNNATTQPVISDGSFAIGDELSIEITQIGATVPGKGLKILLR